MHTTTPRQSPRRARHRPLSWYDKGLKALDRFVATHGHARVPGVHWDADHCWLSEWVDGCREQYAAGALHWARIRALESRPRWTWRRRPTREEYPQGAEAFRQATRDATHRILVESAPMILPDGLTPTDDASSGPAIIGGLFAHGVSYWAKRALPDHLPQWLTTMERDGFYAMKTSPRYWLTFVDEMQESMLCLRTHILDQMPDVAGVNDGPLRARPFTSRLDSFLETPEAKAAISAVPFPDAWEHGWRGHALFARHWIALCAMLVAARDVQSQRHRRGLGWHDVALVRLAAAVRAEGQWNACRLDAWYAGSLDDQRAAASPLLRQAMSSIAQNPSAGLRRYGISSPLELGRVVVELANGQATARNADARRGRGYVPADGSDAIQVELAAWRQRVANPLTERLTEMLDSGKTLKQQIAECNASVSHRALITISFDPQASIHWAPPPAPTHPTTPTATSSPYGSLTLPHATADVRTATRISTATTHADHSERHEQDGVYAKTVAAAIADIRSGEPGETLRRRTAAAARQTTPARHLPRLHTMTLLLAHPLTNVAWCPLDSVVHAAAWVEADAACGRYILRAGWVVTRDDVLTHTVDDPTLIRTFGETSSRRRATPSFTQRCNWLLARTLPTDRPALDPRENRLETATPTPTPPPVCHRTGSPALSTMGDGTVVQTRAERYEYNMSAAREYSAEHGHLIPKKRERPHGVNLYMFLEQQEQAWRCARMPEARRVQLGQLSAWHQRLARHTTTLEQRAN